MLEILRIKGALILKRNAARDYIDFLALADRLGERRSAAALLTLDALYPQPNHQSALRQLLVQIASPRPYDREKTDLATYKDLSARYDSWPKLERIGVRFSNAVFDRLLRDAAGRSASDSSSGDAD